MNFFKKFVYQSTGVVFKLLLLVLPILFALTVVFGTPTHIKTAFKESRLYDQIVGVIIDNSKKKVDDANTQQVLSQPEIRATAEQAFSPTVLQNATENIIEGVYAWLNGTTPTPEFTVDLTGPKATLIQGVTDFAVKRADSLPVCTLQQLQTLNPNMDLLSIPCRPPGINTQQAADEFARQFEAGADFLDDPVITNKTLAKNNDGRSIDQQAAEAPKLFRAIQTGKWIALGAAIVLAAALIFARHNRRAGMRHVAWGMISIAVFLVIGQIVYWFLFDKVNLTEGPDAATHAMIVDGTQVLIREFNKVLLYFTVAYGVVGAGLLLYLRLKPAADEPLSDPLVGEPDLSNVAKNHSDESDKTPLAK